MKSPEACRNIEDVRMSIDSIDQEIIGLLGKRFSYVKKIVEFKPRDKNSIIAKERRESVICSRRELAVKNGLDADIIEKIYRILIDYFIGEELTLISRNED